MCIHSGRHSSALFSCALLNSCGISMNYNSSFFLEELQWSRTCPTVVMDLLQMYNKWYPVGNGLAAAGSTWQSILHELWGESITLPRVESLWATGGQGLNKTIPCCRMRGYWEHAVEWTCSPRAIFALPSASYEDSTNSISYPKIRLMCLL